jgi:uncharacterized circularly permuted ATP-grasp superfamily protein
MEWASMQAGLAQRVKALNCFIRDAYHGQDMVRAGLIPTELVRGNSQYRPEMEGIQVPNDVYANIAGIDIVRAPMSRATASTTCSKTICACHRAFPTCWKTAA